MTIPRALILTTAMTTLGFIFYIVGMSTPNWTLNVTFHGDTVHRLYVGLFEMCSERSCERFTDLTIPGFLKAIQAMIILGFLSAFIACGTPVVGCVYTIKLKPVPRILLPVGLIAGIATFVFTIIGISVYLGKMYTTFTDDEHVSVHLGYSFALVCTGAILVLVGGILFRCRKGSASDFEGTLIPVA